MTYTKEQLRDLRDAIDAQLANKLVQYKYPNGEWSDFEGGKEPEWSIHGGVIYRPKPGPITRPWNRREDVPGPVCWIRWIGSMELLVTALSKSGIRLGGVFHEQSGCYETSWENFAERLCEYSTDRVTWKPCTIEVSA